MPKRVDIENILVIGAGPIIIGQACEFDYSGSQGCKALKEEGYRVILLNSNPATIMTDPDFADATYIEPITPETVEKIIVKERVDAILPTLGGQTALNCISCCYEEGMLKKHRVKLLGANYEAIKKAEDRQEFRKTMKKIGADVPQSYIARSIEEGMEHLKHMNFPLIIRPSYTLGGTGGGIVHTKDEFLETLKLGLEKSRIHQVLIEESLIGWKEYELEIMRDRRDNVVIICTIENIDPMGIHTGDSVTVAPAQTLTDREYQTMRNLAKEIIREIGVDTGGSNVQFAVHPQTGRIVVIEINPRVSRSSALASKATGFPIAKIASKLAIGYTLNEIPNDITKKTPASFEPSIDYCVVKIPRFTFEKFPGSRDQLGVSMQSIGEVMSIGRTFKEALQKGINSLENDLEFGLLNHQNFSENEIIEKLSTPNSIRLYYIYLAFQRGMSLEQVFNHTQIDVWFLDNILQIVEVENELKLIPLEDLSYDNMKKAKELGFSDATIASWHQVDEEEVRKLRKSLSVEPVYKEVDTCAAEFEAFTPYYYSTYEQVDEVKVSANKKVIILGAGPNRIGQGIEFDYCCCQASFAMKDMGIESIMLNCNPETVSTDYDTSDRLYFEPLTYEHVMNIVEKENPLGVILQFGGQTPLKLAKRLHQSGVKIFGTSFDAIDMAEDRDRFTQLITKIGLRQPRSAASYTIEEAIQIAENIGYPVLVRPSYVLGGRAMEIVHDRRELETFMNYITDQKLQFPILIDQFLESAIEVDVDAICDGTSCIIAGIMEHIEKAGVHSGDSSCSLPPFSLEDSICEELKEITKLLAIEMKIKGLLNIQFAIVGRSIYVLEVNPRASRTVPFVSKATGIPWAKLSTQVCMGASVSDLTIPDSAPSKYYSVKEVVFPFSRIHGSNIRIGVEMHSTGETMGIGTTFFEAYTKALIAAQSFPTNKQKHVYIELRKRDKRSSIFTLKELVRLGYTILTDTETAHILEKFQVPTHSLPSDDDMKWKELNKLILQNELSFVLITNQHKSQKAEEFLRNVDTHTIPYLTTLDELEMYVSSLDTLEANQLDIYALQSLHQ